MITKLLPLMTCIDSVFDLKVFVYTNPQCFSVTSVFLLLQALYNEYVHFKETEIPAKEIEKGHIEHFYKLLEVRMNRGGT